MGGEGKLKWETQDCTMAVTLKNMLENLDHFLELLALSRTAYVKDWDVLNLQRALEWGSYFQHVYDRFKVNSSIRNCIEDHLALKNRELQVHFQVYQDLCFRDLRKGKAILCMALLHNNAVPSPLFKYLLELLQEPDSKSIDHLGMDHVVSQKAASDFFLSLPLLACNGSQNPLGNPVLVTQANILRSNLKRRLMISEDGQKQSVVLDVLSRIPRPRVYQLIAVMLSSDDTLGSGLEDQLNDALLDWLMSDNTAWTGFCVNVNPQGLTRLISRHFKLWNIYLDYLVKLGGNMEQSIHSEIWASSNPKLSFHEFLEHFRCLLKGPDDLKEFIFTRVQTLKSQDGDYDVSGISIWTDVLNELKKF